MKCNHKSTPEPTFEIDLAAGLSVQEVRRYFPRPYVWCGGCGCHIIIYASKEHYVYGDW